MFVKEDSDRKKKRKKKRKDKKEKEIIVYNVIIGDVVSMKEESIPRMKFRKDKITLIKDKKHKKR